MDPKFLLFTEKFELLNKEVVNVEVELDYSRENGLFVSHVTWLDHRMDLIAFTSLPWKEQVWLMEDLNRKLDRHMNLNYERAFAHYELNKEL